MAKEMSQEPHEAANPSEEELLSNQSENSLDPLEKAVPPSEQFIFPSDRPGARRVQLSDEAADDAEALSSLGLTLEQREQRRLAKKPVIDHLPDGIYHDPATGDRIPLFNIGDRIVVERSNLLQPGRWLDTRCYTVKQIDDETGHVWCMDEEYAHKACVGFKHPGQVFKLANKKGNPFNVQRVVVEVKPGEIGPNGKKKRKPKRPKHIIEAEKKAYALARKERKEKRALKRKAREGQ